MKEISGLLVSEKVGLREALSRLDATAEGILLMVDKNGRLVRTVTDGDIRRLLLAGFDLAAPLSALPPHDPLTATVETAEEEVFALLDQHLLNHMPVVDSDGRPVSLILRREGSKRIYLSSPHMGTEEKVFVEQAFSSNWIAPLGPNVDAFERELAEYVGIGHAAAVSSGTAAIHLALRLLDVGPGDAVFCSSLTFIASANPILYQGAEPVFIDSDVETWNMSPVALERGLSEAKRQGRLPKAVIAVSLYGQSADMNQLLDLCAAYGVPLIEDAAESLGATYKGKASGTFGLMGIYSFNGNKIITTSGGGMLIAEDETLIRRARHLATQAREPAAHYEHVVAGYNYRMSNVLAGIGRGQLRVLSDRVAQRRNVFEIYKNCLEGIEGITWMPEALFGTATRWLTAMTIDYEVSGRRPADVIDALAKENIEARPVWKPLHLQPLFSGCRYFSHGIDGSVSDKLFDCGICLPSGSDLTELQVKRVASIIRDVFPQGPSKSRSPNSQAKVQG